MINYDENKKNGFQKVKNEDDKNTARKVKKKKLKRKRNRSHCEETFFQQKAFSLFFFLTQNGKIKKRKKKKAKKKETSPLNVWNPREEKELKRKFLYAFFPRFVPVLFLIKFFIYFFHFKELISIGRIFCFFKQQSNFTEKHFHVLW